MLLQCSSGVLLGTDERAHYHGEKKERTRYGKETLLSSQPPSAEALPLTPGMLPLGPEAMPPLSSFKLEDLRPSLPACLGTSKDHHDFELTRAQVFNPENNSRLIIGIERFTFLYIS